MFAKPKQVPKQLDFDELLELKRNLDLEILGRHDGAVEALKTKVTTVASALGITIAELFEPRRQKRSARAK